MEAASRAQRRGSNRRNSGQQRAFGLRTPPPAKHLRKILANYPEGSQIFKEALQNADDAGASEFYILLDERHHAFGPHMDAALEPFMGPAICFGNDSVFADNDWSNLQNMFDSDKNARPAKIGRFGMGSRSYFHVTDLLVVASGSHFAFIDPDLNLNDGGGQIVNFEMLPQDLTLSQVETQILSNDNLDTQEWTEEMLVEFEVFINMVKSCRGVFGFEQKYDAPLNKLMYNRTVFRLPLRLEKWASRSSFAPHECSVVKAAGFIDKFIAESAHSLLFLQSVRSIRIQRWKDGDTSPTDVFYTSVRRKIPGMPKATSTTRRDAKRARRKREEKNIATTQFWPPSCIARFLDGLKTEKQLASELRCADSGTLPEINDVVEVLTCVSAQCTEFEDPLSALLADEPIASEQFSPHLPPWQTQKASVDFTDGFRRSYRRVEHWAVRCRVCPTQKLLKYIHSTLSAPIVGIACRLPPVDTTESCPQQELGTSERVTGTTSCYLPLPDVCTGLPVHIHGTFQLSDNRRSMWRLTPDTDGQAERWAKWNELLLAEGRCLPKLYAEMLQGLPRDDAYSNWPDVKTVETSFKTILRPLADHLKGMDVLWAELQCGALSGVSSRSSTTSCDSTWSSNASTAPSGSNRKTRSSKRQQKDAAQDVQRFKPQDCSFLRPSKVEREYFDISLLKEIARICQFIGQPIVCVPEHVLRFFDEYPPSRKPSKQVECTASSADQQPCIDGRTKKQSSVESMSVLDVLFDYVLPHWTSHHVTLLQFVPFVSEIMLGLCQTLGRSHEEYHIWKFKSLCCDLRFIPLAKAASLLQEDNIQLELPNRHHDRKSRRRDYESSGVAEFALASSTVLYAPIDCYEPSLSTTAYRATMIPQPRGLFAQQQVLRVLRMWGLRQQISWEDVAKEAANRLCAVNCHGGGMLEDVTEC